MPHNTPVIRERSHTHNMAIFNRTYDKFRYDQRNVLKPLISFFGLFVISVGTGLILVQKPFPLVSFFVFAGFLLIGIHNWRWSVYGLLFYLPYAGIPILAFYPSKIPLLIKDWYRSKVFTFKNIHS